MDAVSRFASLTTAHLTDGCLRAGLEVRCAPAGTRSATAGHRLSGRVLPARHSGSVDIFLEALDTAWVGDVLVVDNAGLLDESCVGDLMVLEAAGAGVSGLLVWGLHRDSVDIAQIGLPVFSLGSLSTGPLSVRPRREDALVSATIGAWVVSTDDWVFGDEDGAVFVPGDRLDEVLAHAEQIRDTERHQAEEIRAGRSLRSQVRFAEYLAARSANPSLTFREHLRTVGGEIEV